jgi:hypothetical protein
VIQPIRKIGGCPYFLLFSLFSILFSILIPFTYNRNQLFSLLILLRGRL